MPKMFRLFAGLAVVHAFCSCSEKAPAPAPEPSAPAPAKPEPPGNTPPVPLPAQENPEKHSAGTAANPLSGIADKKEQMKSMKDAKTLHTWLLASSLDKDGAFPGELNEMANQGIFEKAQGDAVMAGVIEYRGKGLNANDDVQILLFRYRAGKDHEVRALIGGKCEVVASDTPVPPAPAK
ncbi:MAG TPA: hypothetical protein VG796_00705 [Verrucomicrobiales bacterium]|nr:hypothetical protein [Verrucomicrobiales bacterium]